MGGVALACRGFSSCLQLTMIMPEGPDSKSIKIFAIMGSAILHAVYERLLGKHVRLRRSSLILVQSGSTTGGEASHTVVEFLMKL